MGEATVTTTAGVVEGRRTHIDGTTVLAFGGVPYAAPPTGRRRFAAPQPPPPWAGVRDATRPGAGPPQLAGDELVPDMTPARTDEDCLTAEVFTPALDGSRPVLVWIPGGAFQIGAAGLATYDGSRLAAEHDLVVVGLNYRLGVLGFLALDGVPTNLGLRDLVAALGWIRTEIAAFGGDPERVTMIGESAGAGAIAHLLAAPAAHGLFRGAILQSGAPAATLDRARAATVVEAFGRHLGTLDLEELRATPVDALLDAQAKTADALVDRLGKMPFHPLVDDDFLPLTPLDAARSGRLAAVPLVVGTTADEMALFRDQVPDLPDDVAQLVLGAKLTMLLGGDHPELAVAGHQACGRDFLRAIADVDLHLPALLLADAQTRAGHPVYRYRFAWDGTGHGAAHAHDLPFDFGTLDVADWRRVVGADRGGAADELSRRMRQAWAAFAIESVPSCDPVGPWPAHHRDDWAATVLGAEVVTVADLDRYHLQAWLPGPSLTEPRR